MAHYRCPTCHDEVDVKGFARVTWCNACGQPLTMLDLLPVRPVLERSEPGPASAHEEEPAALA
jgi:hypothetical protein